MPNYSSGMGLIKICGLSEESTLQVAIDAGANFIGLVHFPKSPRHLSLARAAELKRLIAAPVQSVMVLVDADDDLLRDVIATVSPDYIQLHGHETPSRVAEIRKQFPAQKFIKAIAVRSGDDIAAAHAFEPFVDMLLFDAKPAENATLPGGNGLSFDWALLKGRQFTVPWLLSGGLTPDNVADAIHQTQPYGVDVSSGVERAAGVKDVVLITTFISAAKNQT